MSQPNSSPPPSEPTSVQQGGPKPTTLQAAWHGATLPELRGLQVLRLIGQGGMGQVFEAEDRMLRRRVAVKRMHAHLAADPDARARFLREAQAQAALNKHPHIAPIYSIGEDGGTPYLVMPLLEGESLEDRLRRDPPPTLAEVLRWTRDAALGLHAAHQRGLIHRDVKPANLWLESPHRHLLILDFGLARSLDAGEHLTQTGGVLGTPSYMSPEQAHGQRTLDGRSDLFSLGIVLYRMLGGVLPFRGDSTFSLLRSIVEDTPKPIEQLNPAAPPELSRLLQAMLAKDPAGRPASGEAVALELERIESQLHGQAHVPPRRPAAEPSTASVTPLMTRTLPAPAKPLPPRLRRSAMLASLAGAALLLALLAVILPGKRGGDTGPDLAQGKPGADTQPGPGEGKTPPPPTPPAVEPKAAPPAKQEARLSGSITATIYRRNADGVAETLPLAKALPLREGDKFRVSARANEPAYFYVLWVDTQGMVTPVHPWKPGKWGTRPQTEEPATELNLPPKADEGWNLDDSEGMETLWLLATREPLKQTDAEIQRWFADLPAQQQIPNPRTAVWFDNGQVERRDPDRAPRFEQTVDLNSPLLKMHALLNERVQKHVQLLSGVSFAHVADGAKKE